MEDNGDQVDSITSESSSEEDKWNLTAPENNQNQSQSQNQGDKSGSHVTDKESKSADNSQ